MIKRRPTIRVKRKPRRIAAQFPPNKLLEAKRTPPVSEGLSYKITATDDNHTYELFTSHPYTAAIAQQALADRTGQLTHLMLGSRNIGTEGPKRRRKGQGK